MKNENKKRLVICFDGTWNTENDSTNVVHQHHLTKEGLCSDGVVQKRYYDRGVGTGVLDQIIGGVLGIGLDVNVLEAYLWLMDNYDDDDDVYIFGFSRGAYSARSLVGFIASFGLMRRGSPLSVNQLWDDYKKLNPDEYKKIDKRRYPQIKSARESCKAKRIVDGGEQATATCNEQHCNSCPEISERENAILQWSRRVPIKFLGVYDTVGALGPDALAIPGVKSRRYRYHDMRPSSMILKCRHALAVNEYRVAFNHTPFVAHVGDDFAEAESRRLQNEKPESIPEDNIESKKVAQDQLSLWSDRIEQCWFTGAHSNIGGGYASNGLAVAPLIWVLEGAQNCGLHLLAHKTTKPDTTLSNDGKLITIVDSFAEFLRGAHRLTRSRRNFRDISPRHEPLPRPASHQPYEDNADQPNPYRASVNVSVHPSVLAYYEQNKAEPIPPNLVRYAKSSDNQNQQLRELVRKQGSRSHYLHWLCDMNNKGFMQGAVILCLWSALAAVGALSAWNAIANTQTGGLNYSAAVLITTCLVFVDWLEDRSNYNLALEPYSPGHKALRSALFLPRAAGVLCCLLGTLVVTLSVTESINELSYSSHLLTTIPVLLACLATAVVVIFAIRLIKSNTLAKFINSLLKSRVTTLLGLIAGTATLIAIAAGYALNSSELLPKDDASLAGMMTIALITLAPALHALIICTRAVRDMRMKSWKTIFSCMSLHKFKQHLKACELKVLSIYPSERAKNVREAISRAVWTETLYLVPMFAITWTLTIYIALTQFELGFTRWILLIPAIYALVALTANILIGYFLEPDNQNKETLFYLSALASLCKYLLFLSGACTIAYSLLFLGIREVFTLGAPWVCASAGWQGKLLLVIVLLYLLWIISALLKLVGSTVITNGDSTAQERRTS